MSLPARREYIATMRQRYWAASGKLEKSRLLDELVMTLGYQRKYAIAILRAHDAPKKPKQRSRVIQYREALPAIQKIWETLDYPCAERLHPMLLKTAEKLADHHELTLTETICEQLSSVSRATLARRIHTWRTQSTRPHAAMHHRPANRLRHDIPVRLYDWDEQRLGALEIDLVVHSGASSLGHFAYTLSTVDMVTGYSRRCAVLGRGQAAICAALTRILDEWPHAIWGLHCDNGTEFINSHLLRIARQRQLEFTRSRPYKKNDNAHVEQKNRFYVRDIVGYERYDTPDQVKWLNDVYAWLDAYANFVFAHAKGRGQRARSRADTQEIR